MIEVYKEIGKVKTKEDFVKFITLLVEDFKNNPQEWENNNLETFLEGIASWVEDMEGYYINNKLPLPKNIDWNFFATVFYAAKIYE